MAMTRRSVFSLAAVTILVLPMTAAAQDTVRIVQTNSAGDNVHIIDPVTNTVVGEVTGIERAHGVQPTPDGRWLYVANESDDTADVVDVATMMVTKKIPLSGRPNNVAMTPDGRKLYVAIAQSPGALDVIDTATNEITATISVHGGVHNTYVTPDGKYAIAGMVGARNITVVDTKTDMPVWTTYFDRGIRPDGLRYESRWIDPARVCAALESQRLWRRGLRDAEGSDSDRVSRRAAGASDPRPRREHGAWHRRDSRQQVSGREQQPEQQRLRVHAS